MTHEETGRRPLEVEWRAGPSRGARWGAVITGGLFVMLAVAAQALLRDPTSRINARRSHLVAVQAEREEVSGGHRVQNVRLRAASGLEVGLAIKWPDTPVAPDERRTLMLLLGGHRTGRDAVNLIGETRGVVIAAVSYPFGGNDRVKGLRVLPEVPGIRRALLDTPPALMLALDYLLTRPGIDSVGVELVGVSLGAPFVCIAGALDSRFSRVWSIHGAGDPYVLLDHNLQRRIPFAPARAAVASVAYLLINGPHLQPERWVGRIAPRPFVMINAEEDERLPRSAVERLHERALAPREITWMPGPHVLPRRAELVQRLVDTVLERVPGASGS